MITYGFFTYGTCPRHHPYSSRLPVSSNHSCQPPSPDHSSAVSSVTRLSPRLRYYSVVRLLTWHRFPFRFAYRVAYSGATREPCEFSWGHSLIFRTVPSANTLVRWVDENAFASIVQARPCPTFGRPVRLWDGSLDYGPVLLLIPFGFHLTMDTLSSGCCRQRSNLGASPCLFPPFPASCPFRVLLICSPRPARHYPRFWI